MGLATQQSSQQGVVFQGILGVGFASDESIAATTGGQTYPNFPEVLQSSGIIATQSYSLWLNDLKSNTGSILFGGVDTSKYHGDLSILAIAPDQQSGTLTSFTVVLDNIEVIGNQKSTQYSAKNMAAPVVLDSGTTLTYLPDNIANAILNGVGAINTDEFGPVVPCYIATTPATINFGFGNANGVTIAVPISEFVIPFPPGTDAPRFKANNAPACLWGLLPAGDAPNLLGDTFPARRLRRLRPRQQADRPGRDKLQRDRLQRQAHLGREQHPQRGHHHLRRGRHPDLLRRRGPDQRRRRLLGPQRRRRDRCRLDHRLRPDQHVQSRLAVGRRNGQQRQQVGRRLRDADVRVRVARRADADHSGPVKESEIRLFA